MKLKILIEWDGPFPADVAMGRFDSLRTRCLDPGYEVRRYEYKGIWANADGTISFGLELEIRNIPPPIEWWLAPAQRTSGQTLALLPTHPIRSSAMSTTHPILEVPLSHPNNDWRQVHDALRANEAAWKNLAFDGIQSDGRGGLLENRRCPECGSTIGRAILPIDALEVCQQFAGIHARSLEAVSSSLHIAQARAMRLRRRSRSS